jgi:spermidine synthase
MTGCLAVAMGGKEKRKGWNFFMGFFGATSFRLPWLDKGSADCGLRQRKPCEVKPSCSTLAQSGNKSQSRVLSSAQPAWLDQSAQAIQRGVANPLIYRNPMILLLFFCSGVTALIYEVIWSKYLALLFGSTIQAQTMVLAVFMGGLALGNKLFSVRADRARRPLAVYGWIEIGIGLYAVFFSLLYRAADGIFVFVGSGLMDHSGWLLLLKGLLSAGLLGGPTVLMGGTLPILAAWLQKNMPDAGRRSARFYSTNSLGAVCGAGLAGFFLIPAFGLPVTSKIAALVNGLIGLAAIGISQKRSTPFSTASRISPSTKPSQPPSAKIFRWGCLVVALTGAVSMGLEVLASRCLGLIFGSSLQAFATVLMAFILGLGLGSAVIASPRRSYWPKEITTVVLLLVAAAVIGLVVFNIENLVEIYRYARSGLSATVMGYRYYQIVLLLMSLGVLGLPAAALGAVLPLWMRVVSEASDLLGDRVGRLLTWNTLGAVGGVLVTGFVLMPTIGLRGSFATLALVLALAAVFMTLATRQFIAAGAGVAVSLGLLLVSARGGEGWRYALTAGMFRLHETDPSLAPIADRRKVAQLLFYEDAADATVSVERDESGSSPELVLRINGKADASSHTDFSTQILLGQLPLMTKPDSQDVFCFGLGSGITAGTALGYPIAHLTVAENCEPVLRAAKLFEPWNQGVLTDSRVRIYREDARTVLKLSSQKYDAIIAEPSNPWVVNVGSVFSFEFYQLAASRLKPGGIMTQWFHTYEMDDATVDLVLRTFAAVFPHMEIWDASPGDIILLGSDRPWKADPDACRRAFDLDAPRRDLASIGLTSPEAVFARQLASQRTAFAVPNPGPMQRDGFPMLEYAAPRAMYLYSGRQAQRLLRFDERTYQSNLAPSEKNRALSQLDEAALKTIFCDFFPSVNPRLQQFVRARVEGYLAQDSHIRSLPCVFRGASNVAVFEPPLARTDIMVHQLANAEAMLGNSTADPSQAVAGIKNVLDEIQTYNQRNAGWSAGHYANLAAEESLHLGNMTQAKAIIVRGLQLEPDSEELLYLSRILVREGMLQPAEFSPGP